jgi:hypothetical protein
VIVGAMAMLTIGLGVTAYGVHVRASTLPGLIVALVLGTAAFTTLGIGVTRFIPTAESAPVFVNLSILPWTFISSIWFPTDGMPSGLQTIAWLAPCLHRRDRPADAAHARPEGSQCRADRRPGRTGPTGRGRGARALRARPARPARP